VVSDICLCHSLLNFLDLTRFGLSLWCYSGVTMVLLCYYYVITMVLLKCYIE
jgi:hypothetical protein